MVVALPAIWSACQTRHVQMEASPPHPLLLQHPGTLLRICTPLESLRRNSGRLVSMVSVYMCMCG